MSRSIPTAIALGLVLAIGIWTGRADAVSPCGGESDTLACGSANPCGCCEKPGETWPNGTCGNCVWHAWHMACNGWGVAIPWACTDAHMWNQLASGAGYQVDGTPSASSIFVCEASPTWSDWGHVGWIVSVNANGSSNTTEQFCSSTNCGTFDRVRAAGFADDYIHHGSVTPTEVDDADFVSETVPDGTQITAGHSFVKRWTMRNAGNTTWTKSDGYTWDYVENEQFGAAAQTDLPSGTSVAPGDTFAWDVPMTAPTTPGTYRGYWRMNHVGKSRFGDKVWVEIVVVSGPPPDAGTPDTGTSDAGTPDTGTSDAGTPDTGTSDTGTQDDAQRPDAGTDALSWPDGSTPDDGFTPWPESGAPEKDGGASGSGYDPSEEEASGCACGLPRSRPSPGAASIALALLLAAAACRRSRRVQL